jgi:uncharacterized protein YjbI with pentapeptide repeats
MEGRRKQAAGEKEARKLTWRRGPQDRTLQSEAWTLKALGGKTVWDWLQLLGVLAIPVVIAVGGWMFNAQQTDRQNELENKRAKSDQHIEEQRAQDAALQAYLDQMSQLMLEGDLRGEEAGSEVRTLARARTRTILARLDSDRKGSVVQFLYEASLIDKERSVVSLYAVSLHGADLSGLKLQSADLFNTLLINADLSGADLSSADLSEAQLIGADLRGAALSGTHLSGANLEDADLRGAALSGAHLSGARLGDAELREAILRDADLRDAYLSNADLSGADLSSADLRGSYLNDADLRDADVTQAQLSHVESLEDATMPDGSIHH